VAKQPLAAYEDAAFAREAREISSTTFIAHVRYATTGDVLAQNTHPCSPHTMSYGRCATPDTHELWVLERPAGGTSGDRHLDGAGAAGTVHVRSMHLMEHGSVIVASEPLDDDSGWRLLAAGEILHVVPSLEVRSERALVGPPTHPLTLSDLEPRAASAQAPTA